MNHGDAERGGMGPMFTDERKLKGKLAGKNCKRGDVGTMAQVLGGDEIEVQAKSGKWYTATVAWPYPDGAAMLRMNDSLDPDAMRVMGKTVPVRWRKVRPR